MINLKCNLYLALFLSTQKSRSGESSSRGEKPVQIEGKCIKLLIPDVSFEVSELCPPWHSPIFL